MGTGRPVQRRRSRRAPLTEIIQKKHPGTGAVAASVAFSPRRDPPASLRQPATTPPVMGTRQPRATAIGTGPSSRGTPDNSDQVWHSSPEDQKPVTGLPPSADHHSGCLGNAREHTGQNPSAPPPLTGTPPRAVPCAVWRCLAHAKRTQPAGLRASSRARYGSGCGNADTGQPIGRTDDRIHTDVRDEVLAFSAPRTPGLPSGQAEWTPHPVRLCENRRTDTGQPIGDRPHPGTPTRDQFVAFSPGWGTGCSGRANGRYDPVWNGTTPAKPHSACLTADRKPEFGGPRWPSQLPKTGGVVGWPPAAPTRKVRVERRITGPNRSARTADRPPGNTYRCDVGVWRFSPDGQTASLRPATTTTNSRVVGNGPTTRQPMTGHQKHELARKEWEVRTRRTPASPPPAPDTPHQLGKRRHRQNPNRPRPHRATPNTRDQNVAIKPRRTPGWGPRPGRTTHTIRYGPNRDTGQTHRGPRH